MVARSRNASPLERLPRLHVTTSHRVPWLRIGVEAGAIVVSILLAFAINTSWDQRQDRKSERNLLESLHRDFNESRASLSSVIAGLERAQVQFARFQSAAPEQLEALPADAIPQVINALYTGITFDPVSSTLDAAQRDGRLSLLQDPSLARLLADWSRAWDDIAENETDVRAGARRVRLASGRYGGPFYHPALPREANAFLPEARGATLGQLRQDAGFVADVRELHYSFAFYLRELRVVASLADSITVRIDSNLQ